MAIALIFDCGATNLRTIAINEKDKFLPLITLLIIQNKESNHLIIIFGILKKSGKINLLCNSNPQSINATRY